MPQKRLTRYGRWSELILGVLLTILSACSPSPDSPGTGVVTTWSPTPTPDRAAELALPANPTSDRLAEPALPANSTQYEQGRHLYWLNCMPCHGDSGQGLTDEFRSLWEVDHQNCWGRGCHTGREGEEGYPLPRSIPAIISSSGDLPPFATAEQLFEYLRLTHPPQHPGYLSDNEYWAITAYILTENQRLPLGQKLGP